MEASKKQIPGYFNIRKDTDLLEATEQLKVLANPLRSPSYTLVED